MNLETLRETMVVRGFSLFKIPLLFFCSPSVLELSDSRCVVRIPRNRRTQNHLKSLYFGALCVGADCAGGLIAMRAIQKRKAPVSLIFKDFQAEFLKRAEGDTHFTCDDGEAILVAVERAIRSGERENIPVRITATVPSKSGDEPVARFTLTLSLKKKGS
jgi:acyl-coenzyme A thioesterase PaaI-like protein